jgi:hypothetical protein
VLPVALPLDLDVMATIVIISRPTCGIEDGTVARQAVIRGVWIATCLISGDMRAHNSPATHHDQTLMISITRNLQHNNYTAPRRRRLTGNSWNRYLFGVIRPGTDSRSSSPRMSIRFSWSSSAVSDNQGLCWTTYGDGSVVSFFNV